MQTKVYNQEGKEVSKFTLPEQVFGVSWNNNLVHQVFVSMASNARMTLAHSKGRSEVRGGGRKPWKQKGTGRARHGSRRSPIWRGGGITFGPTQERNFQKKINKKMKAKALYIALSQKIREREILFIDKISLAEVKTKYAKEVLKNLSTIPGFESLSTKKKNAVLMFFPHKDDAIVKSFRNFGNVEIERTQQMNLFGILNYKYLVIVDPKNGIGILENKLSKKENQESPNTKAKFGTGQAGISNQENDKRDKKPSKLKVSTTKKLKASARGGSASGRKN